MKNRKEGHQNNFQSWYTLLTNNMSSKSEFTYLITPIFTYCTFTTFLKKKNQSSFFQGICYTSLILHNIKEGTVPKEMWAANFPVSKRTIS